MQTVWSNNVQTAQGLRPDSGLMRALCKSSQTCWWKILKSSVGTIKVPITSSRRNCLPARVDVQNVPQDCFLTATWWLVDGLVHCAFGEAIHWTIIWHHRRLKSHSLDTDYRQNFLKATWPAPCHEAKQPITFYKLHYSYVCQLDFDRHVSEDHMASWHWQSGSVWGCTLLSGFTTSLDLLALPSRQIFLWTENLLRNFFK